MSLTVAVQMDPIQNIRIAGDTTFALLLEAQRRGHALVGVHQDDPVARGGLQAHVLVQVPVLARVRLDDHPRAGLAGQLRRAVGALVVHHDHLVREGQRGQAGLDVRRLVPRDHHRRQLGHAATSRPGRPPRTPPRAWRPGAA